MNVNHKIILYFIGFLLLFNGGFMFVSSMVSYYYQDGITIDLIYSGTIVMLIGGLLLFLNRNHDKQLNKKEGYLVVVLGWLAMISTGTIPYIITGTIDGFSNIMFETTSGFTTTGATILNDIEILLSSDWCLVTVWSKTPGNNKNVPSSGTNGTLCG